MKKIYIIIIGISIVVVATVALFYYKAKLSRVVLDRTDQPTTTTSDPTPNTDDTVVPTEPSAPNNDQAVTADRLLNTLTRLDYPLPDFASRSTINLFGNYYPSGTPRNKYPDSVCSNNTLFTGYHAADDLEITSTEQNIDVPVYAISDGIVQFAGSISGYGGLIILSFTYQSQSYTALYGHVDIRTLKFSKGQSVKRGDSLANLAPACSSYSGNNRKHLHFGIHKGTAIVVSGYVSTKDALNNWLNPKQFFGL